MAKRPLLVDASGMPLPPSQRGPRASLDGGWGGAYPYDAARWSSTEMRDWHPLVQSPDTEINWYRDRMTGRTRDLVRNDGWAAGIVNRILDSTIGGSYRLSAHPDHRLLRMYDKSFDHVWAQEFRRAAEALWRNYADDLGRWNDRERLMTVGQQFRLLLRSKMVDGDSLVVSYWMPDRIGRGAAKFATAFEVVDSDRLSNPALRMDTKYLRNGVELNDDGAAIAYHIRQAHQWDWYNAKEAMTWERVEREDPDGWHRVIHDFDRDRAAQHRGVSVFAPVIPMLKMLARYYGVELQAHAISAVFGTYVVSPNDQELLKGALEDDDGEDKFRFYQDIRREHHDRNKISLNDARIPTLAPGEDIKSVSVDRPMGEFSAFTHEMLRGVASVLGVTAEQVTQDYGDVNYSSARAAILEAEKTFKRRIADFNANTATPMYATWLQEAVEENLLPMPANAPDFVDYRTAFSRCRWLGAGRGWVDPQSERAGEILGMEAGFNTLENVCAEIEGLDWEDVITQRAAEVEAFKKLGLPVPSWTGSYLAGQFQQGQQPKQDQQK